MNKITLTLCSVLASATFASASTQYVTTQNIDTDQVHLGTSTGADGVITATYSGVATEYFTFDTMGGTRTIDEIRFNYGATYNKYNVRKTAGVEQIEDAKLNMLADVYMYDTNNQVVFSASNVNYNYNTFSNAVDPSFNFGYRDVTITRDVYSNYFTNAAVLNALENGGVRFEIYETITWQAEDLNGDSIATLLRAGNNLGTNHNNYDMSLQSFASDVIPEPSSTALLGLAGLGLILRRRK